MIEVEPPGGGSVCVCELGGVGGLVGVYSQLPLKLPPNGEAPGAGLQPF